MWAHAQIDAKRSLTFLAVTPLDADLAYAGGMTADAAAPAATTFAPRSRERREYVRFTANPLHLAPSRVQVGNRLLSQPSSIKVSAAWMLKLSRTSHQRPQEGAKSAAFGGPMETAAISVR